MKTIITPRCEACANGKHIGCAAPRPTDDPLLTRCCCSVRQEEDVTVASREREQRTECPACGGHGLFVGVGGLTCRNCGAHEGAVDGDSAPAPTNR